MTGIGYALNIILCSNSFRHSTGKYSTEKCHRDVAFLLKEGRFMNSQAENCQIGFIAGAFDLGPHAGHMMMLKECADNCDFLIIGLHTDPSLERSQKNAPVESVYERFIKLSGCRYVDKVIPYETENDLYLMLINEKPDVRFLGDDYKDRDFTGKNVTDIMIHYIDRKHGFSSSGLREKIRNQEKRENVLRENYPN